MAIEDTFGYRFVRISLVLLNCLVLVRLISLLLQYSHVFEPTFVLFILLIGSNFMAAIIGAIREHRIAVLITGSLTLIMFLSLLFTNKENKNINVSLFTLLAIAAQSLIFSEMLKERQIFSQRQNLEIFGPTAVTTAANGSADATRRTTHAGLDQLSAHPHYFVVYQPPESNRRGRQPGGIIVVDPLSPKDPPPSYYSASCPPPKYEDAIKLNQPTATIVPTVSGVSNTTTATNNDSNQQNQEDQSSTTSTTTNTSQNNTPTCTGTNDNEINNNNNASSDNTAANDNNNNNCPEPETSITIDNNENNNQ